MAPGQKKRKLEAMELFPDGRHVRLRSRVRDGLYLYAGEDGVGVHLSPPLLESLHAEWQVHRVERDGNTFLLLHGAAYGRYLEATDDPAPRGHLGQRVVQGVYDDHDEDAVTWSPSTASAKNHHVYLRHITSDLCLRANGKYCRWRTGVSVGKYSNQDRMMHWVVEAIPERSSTPELPLPTPVAPPGSFWNKFLGRTAPVVERRMIRFVRAADDGSFDLGNPRVIEFDGRSVYNLRSTVAKNLNEGSVDRIKLCVRAGNSGRLIPLVTDLPCNEDPVDIIVLSIRPAENLEWVTPLAIDLPRNEESIDIVTLSTSTPEKLNEGSVMGIQQSVLDGTLVPLTPLAIDLPRNEEPIDFSARSTFPPAPMKLEIQEDLHAAALAQLELERTCVKELTNSAEQKIQEISSPIDITKKARGKKKIQQEHLSISAVGEALGEHPRIGASTAEERLQVAEFALHKARFDESKMEVKYQNLQEELRNVHQDLDKKEKRKKEDKLKEVKAEISNKKKECSRLEQEAYNARVVYEREILRALSA